MSVLSIPVPTALSLSKGRICSLILASKERQGFDKLSPNGGFR